MRTLPIIRDITRASIGIDLPEGPLDSEWSRSFAAISCTFGVITGGVLLRSNLSYRQLLTVATSLSAIDLIDFKTPGCKRLDQLRIRPLPRLCALAATLGCLLQAKTDLIWIGIPLFMPAINIATNHTAVCDADASTQSRRN